MIGDYRDVVIAALADDEAASLERQTATRAARRALAKTLICRILIALPSRWCPIASWILGRIWPGFRDA